MAWGSLAQRREHYAKNSVALNDRRRKYREENRDKIRGYNQREGVRLKKQAVVAYGNGACERCNEDDIRILTLDHINQDGAKRRREGERWGGGLYRKLRQKDWPSGFRVLCFNCNRLAYLAYKSQTLSESRGAAYTRRYRSRLKQETIAAYSDGTMVCGRCSEGNLGALTLDHIAQDGGKYRKEGQGRGAGFYAKLRQQGFPHKDKLRILCQNCNWLAWHEHAYGQEGYNGQTGIQ